MSSGTNKVSTEPGSSSCVLYLLVHAPVCMGITDALISLSTSEHKNMPLEDAMGLIDRDFERYSYSPEGRYHYPLSRASGGISSADHNGSGRPGDKSVELMSKAASGDNLSSSELQLLISSLQQKQNMSSRSMDPPGMPKIIRAMLVNSIVGWEICKQYISSIQFDSFRFCMFMRVQDYDAEVSVQRMLRMHGSVKEEHTGSCLLACLHKRKVTCVVNEGIGHPNDCVNFRH